MAMTTGGVLIVSWEGGGNVPPALALAERLRARGHRVRIAMGSSERRAVEAVGAELVPYRSVTPIPALVNHEQNWPLVEANINGPGVVHDLMAAQRADPAEVIVVDSMSGAGLAAGEALGLPMAILVHTLYHPYTTWGPHVVNTRQTRVAAGLRPLADEAFPGLLASAAAVLALVPRDFDFPLEVLAANTHYVGPILAPAAAAAAEVAAAAAEPAAAAAESGQAGAGRSSRPTEPTVLITFGSTVQRQRDALQPVLAAFDGLPARGLLTLGGVLAEGTMSAPRNVDVRGHVPHASILPDVAAVVCHGGLGTIMAALAFGKPLLVINQGRDQAMNAERVAASGAGLSLSPEATPPEIAAALRRVLGEPAFAEAARAWAARIAALGRGEAATDIVEAIALAPPALAARVGVGSPAATA